MGGMARLIVTHTRIFPQPVVPYADGCARPAKSVAVAPRLIGAAVGGLERGLLVFLFFFSRLSLPFARERPLSFSPLLPGKWPDRRFPPAPIPAGHYRTGTSAARTAKGGLPARHDTYTPHMSKRADLARSQGGTNHDERGATKKIPAPAAPPGTLMRLQQTAGNQATVALLEAGQAKLAVGPVGDKYEREADQVATAVLSRLRAGNGSGGVPTVADQEGDEPIGRIVSRLQRAAPEPIGAAGGALDETAEARIASASHGGAPLPDAVRGRMEGAFGADFSSVKLHTGNEAESLNSHVSAMAFTVGSDIFLGRSAPSISSSSGQSLLAHELTHTIQQGGARVRPEDGEEQR